MPTLSAQASRNLEDVELRSVSLDTPLNRVLTTREDAENIEVIVDTSWGPVTVTILGDRSCQRPAILTYHDLGLNYASNFQTFFNFPDMKEILRYFCVYNINAPGQEENAATWPEDKPYPNMDELAEQVSEVLNHFAIVRYIGIGVGLGGNVLLRHSFKYPERVLSLMLVNTTCSTAGWVEWGYQKRNVNHLRSHGITQAVLDYLMWHHLGPWHENRAHDLVAAFKHYFKHEVNPKNLAKLVEQYIWRSSVNIERLHNILGKGNSKTLKVQVFNVVGAYSSFVEETVALNGKLDPANSSWLKVRDAAMVLEEQPANLAEAFLLFLQGQGYCLKVDLKRGPLGIAN